MSFTYYVYDIFLLCKNYIVFPAPENHSCQEIMSSKLESAIEDFYYMERMLLEFIRAIGHKPDFVPNSGILIPILFI